MSSKRIRQHMVACRVADCINYSVKTALDTNKLFEFPEYWFQANREATKLHGWWGGEGASLADYDREAHQAACEEIVVQGERVAKEIAGEIAVSLYQEELKKYKEKFYS